MKALGSKFEDTEGDPIRCCEVCDEVYPEAAALLQVASVAETRPASTMHAKQPEGIDNEQCKTVCQRFGMGALGPKFTDTAGDPVKCCDVCDEEYPAAGLLQTKMHSVQNQPDGIDNEQCKTA